MVCGGQACEPWQHTHRQQLADDVLREVARQLLPLRPLGQVVRRQTGVKVKPAHTLRVAPLLRSEHSTSGGCQCAHRHQHGLVYMQWSTAARVGGITRAWLWQDCMCQLL